jgi:hypothetical protein
MYSFVFPSFRLPTQVIHLLDPVCRIEIVGFESIFLFSLLLIGLGYVSWDVIFVEICWEIGYGIH